MGVSPHSRSALNPVFVSTAEAPVWAELRMIKKGSEKRHYKRGD